MLDRNYSYDYLLPVEIILSFCKICFGWVWLFDLGSLMADEWPSTGKEVEQFLIWQQADTRSD